jgi:predicted NBD/HSP70 family sugar kinase
MCHEEAPGSVTSPTKAPSAFPSKATHQQTRAYNAALVLRALYEHSPISRAEVARMSGLTRTTVGDVVGELIGDGLAREVGRGPSTGGKAPILLELVEDARFVVGLDLGEFVFRGALVDLRGKVRETAERKVEGLDGDQALGIVHELIEELVGRLPGGRRDALLGIGVGTPGIVDAATGTIRWAVNLDWQDLPLGEILRDRYEVPVQVANDSRAAALAIQLFDRPRAEGRAGDADTAAGPTPGAAPGGTARPNLVAITVGRGIGAGVVLGGELFHGDGFGAGEIGHTTVEVDGAECRCGRFGCLETVASSRAILRSATALAEVRPESQLGRRLRETGELRLEDLAVVLTSGASYATGAADTEDVRRIVVSAGRYLGQVIAGVIGVLDVERIVLHGSVAVLGAPWLEAVRDEANRRSLGLLAKAVEIEIAPPIGDLVVMGASALLLTAELGLTVGAGR